MGTLELQFCEEERATRHAKNQIQKTKYFF